ncbi:MAG: hypothetical protein PHY31_02155, partial [Smithellaceae bacterium]|nr:hypothetical protein [Smithellaceae bacterium]
MAAFDEREILSPALRREENFRRFKAMLAAGYAKAERVRRMCQEKGISLDDINSLDDLSRFPVISREQLIALEMEEPPYGGFADSAAPVDRIFISPGPVYEPHLA